MPTIALETLLMELLIMHHSTEVTVSVCGVIEGEDSNPICANAVEYNN